MNPNVQVPEFGMYLKSNFLYDELPDAPTKEYVFCEVFGAVSITRRCLMFHVMTEYGSRHDRVPIHYLVGDTQHSNYPLDWLQLWDCYSPNMGCTVWEHHKNSKVRIQLKNHKWITGRYLFTLDWCNSPEYNLGYAEMAGGHKCGHVILGLEDEDGNPVNQLFCQPNNRVLWMDGGAFITKKFDKRPDWKVFHHEFTCEGTSRWVSEDNFDYFYQFKEDKDK